MTIEQSEYRTHKLVQAEGLFGFGKGDQGVTVTQRYVNINYKTSNTTISPLEKVILLYEQEDLLSIRRSDTSELTFGFRPSQ